MLMVEVGVEDDLKLIVEVDLSAVDTPSGADVSIELEVEAAEELESTTRCEPEKKVRPPSVPEHLE